MTSEAHGAARILGRLGSPDGKGVVRMDELIPAYRDLAANMG